MLCERNCFCENVYSVSDCFWRTFKEGKSPLALKVLCIKVPIIQFSSVFQNGRDVNLSYWIKELCISCSLLLAEIELCPCVRFHAIKWHFYLITLYLQFNYHNYFENIANFVRETSFKQVGSSLAQTLKLGSTSPFIQHLTYN